MILILIFNITLMITSIKRKKIFVNMLAMD